MSKTKIEWTDYSWNPILADNKEKKTAGVKRNRGYGSGTGHYCEKVSAGCKNCYAETQQPRFGNSIKFSSAYKDNVEIYLDEKTLIQPLQWKEPRKIFVCDMSDLFGSWVKNEWLDKIFAVMALTPHHTYQVLTKRPELMKKYFTYVNEFDLYDRWNDAAIDILTEFNFDWHGDFNTAVLPNLWLGTSVEDQKQADERIHFLMDIPAAIRFLSCEPLLGQVDLQNIPLDPADNHKHGVKFNVLRDVSQICEGKEFIRKIDWVIAGGESGSDARPMHPEWPMLLRDQCKEANVPFFFKQWGQYGNGSYLTSALNNNRVIVLNNGEMKTFTPLNENELVKKYGATFGSYSPCVMSKVGKYNSGRDLNGFNYSQYPNLKKIINS